jgi:hypothetical protein
VKLTRRSLFALPVAAIVAAKPERDIYSAVAATRRASLSYEQAAERLQRAAWEVAGPAESMIVTRGDGSKICIGARDPRCERINLEREFEAIEARVREYNGAMGRMVKA